MPPKDDEALAEAIARLMKDKGLGLALSANGRAKAEEYRWERVAGKIMEYYESVAQPTRLAVS